MPASISMHGSNREKGQAMNVSREGDSTRQPNEAATPDVPVRTELEASARALFAADQGHVHEAMNSVRWERRGVLQRLTHTSD